MREIRGNLGAVRDFMVDLCLAPDPVAGLTAPQRALGFCMSMCAKDGSSPGLWTLAGGRFDKPSALSECHDPALMAMAMVMAMASAPAGDDPTFPEAATKFDIPALAAWLLISGSHLSGGPAPARSLLVTTANQDS